MGSVIHRIPSAGSVPSGNLGHAAAGPQARRPVTRWPFTWRRRLTGSQNAFMGAGGRRVRLNDSSGTVRELRTIGAVASVLGRSTETVRRSHACGRLPPPTATLQLEDGRKLKLYDAAYIERAPAWFAAGNRSH